MAEKEMNGAMAGRRVNRHELRTGYRRIVVLLTVVAIGAPIILSIPFSSEPLARDQGYFAFGGWRIGEGDLPYRDFWANTFPGVFWYYAFLDSLSGDHIVPIAIANGMISALSALFIILLNPGIAGILAACIYGVSVTLLHRFWDIGQAEQLVNLFMILSLYSSRRTMYTMSGITFSIAVLCKPISLLFLPLVSWRNRRWVTGVCIPPVVFLLPYVVTGSVPRVFDDLIRFNAAYSGSRWDSAWWSRFIGSVRDWAVARYPLLIFGSVSLRVGGRIIRPFLVWLVLSLAVVGIQAKFFSYHWIPTLVPLSILAGYGLYATTRFHTLMKTVMIVLVIAPIICIPRSLARAWYPAYHEVRIGVRYMWGDTAYESYLEQFGDRSAGADFVAIEQFRLVEFLENLPEGNLLVWGFEPGINYLSKRYPPTRFVVDFPLTFGVDQEPESVLRRAYRTEFLADVMADPPEYLVVVTEDDNPVEPHDSATQLYLFSPFAAYVEDAYAFEYTVGSYLIMRHSHDRR